jgi:hypothetical protein
MQVIKIGAIYKHFKRELIKDKHSNEYLYKVITLCEHTETGEDMVVYQALYAPFKTYVRPYKMFVEEVDTEKYPDIKQKFRFVEIKFE